MYFTCKELGLGLGFKERHRIALALKYKDVTASHTSCGAHYNITNLGVRHEKRQTEATEARLDDKLVVVDLLLYLR